MLVLQFHGKWHICLIQSLLLLTRTFIVGPEWQRESCVTAVLWMASVYIVTSKLLRCIEVPIRLVPGVKWPEHEIDHVAICLSGIVFAQGQFPVITWNDPRAVTFFSFFCVKAINFMLFDWLNNRFKFQDQI